jgi:hypothetical protein
MDFILLFLSTAVGFTLGAWFGHWWALQDQKSKETN